jgi:hypothetical protein
VNTKHKLVVVIALVIVVVAMAGGSWKSTYAQGTVATTQPAQPTTAPTPTSAPMSAVKYQIVSDPSKPLEALMETVIEGAGGVKFSSSTLKKGDSVKFEVIDPANVAKADKVTPLTEFVQVTTTVSGKYTLYFTLSKSEVDAYKKNSNMGILWYDSSKGTWTRLSATLKDGVLSVETDKPGIYTCGVIK